MNNPEMVEVAQLQNSLEMNTALMIKTVELQKENKRLRQFIESYCICSSMGTTGKECMFCADLKSVR